MKDTQNNYLYCKNILICNSLKPRLKDKAKDLNNLILCLEVASSSSTVQLCYLQNCGYSI